MRQFRLSSSIKPLFWPNAGQNIYSAFPSSVGAGFPLKYINQWGIKNPLTQKIFSCLSYDDFVRAIHHSNHLDRVLNEYLHIVRLMIEPAGYQKYVLESIKDMTASQQFQRFLLELKMSLNYNDTTYVFWLNQLSEKICDDSSLIQKELFYLFLNLLGHQPEKVLYCIQTLFGQDLDLLILTNKESPAIKCPEELLEALFLNYFKCSNNAKEEYLRLIKKVFDKQGYNLSEKLFHSLLSYTFYTSRFNDLTQKIWNVDGRSWYQFELRKRFPRKK